jgi:hypothetical protein
MQRRDKMKQKKSLRRRDRMAQKSNRGRRHNRQVIEVRERMEEQAFLHMTTEALSSARPGGGLLARAVALMQKEDKEAECLGK